MSNLLKNKDNKKFYQAGKVNKFALNEFSSNKTNTRNELRKQQFTETN